VTTPLFTVFTPTYNRASTLGRVHDSLLRQTFTDFEWLIVDDGSTDGTADLVEGWQAASPFPIRYVWQPNQGKHVAMNKGSELARGELFLTVDSDDECVPVALERLKHHWDQIPAAERESFAAVTALAMDQHGRLVGTRFPADVLDSTSIELVYRYRMRGDKWGFTRTDVLRAHPFPVAEGTPFIPESLVWDEIALSYRTRFVNEMLLVNWTRPPGGPTARSAAAVHLARGLARWNLYVLNRHMPWFRYDPARFLLSAVRYTRFSLLDHQGPITQVRALRNPFARLLWLATLPFGLAAFLVDRWRAGRQPPRSAPTG
jgi:glycosyltransferase involved in cell wall biosynthesis